MATAEWMTSMRAGVDPAGNGDFTDAWERVLARDASADGRFVYAVTTTGIVCRPSCASRRPVRGNVCFYRSVEDAIAQGYRPCLRCQPQGVHGDVRKVERLCAYLQEHVEEAVSLKRLSSIAELSTFATQRLFERVTGVTPRRYQVGLRAEGLRKELGARKDSTITEAIYKAGYGTSSRLYARPDDALGMKPARFRDGAAGEVLEACVSQCALGWLLVARTANGVCHIALGDSATELEAELRKRFARATIHMGKEGEALRADLDQVLSLLEERPGARELRLDLRATAFQQRVWAALQAIPRGETRSYSQVAEAIGQPSAARAVARACASNTIALAVPCHRVIGGDGALRGYRWGEGRKRRLLGMERLGTR